MFESRGGNGIVRISTSHESCEWQASTDADWVSLEGPLVGKGNGMLRFGVKVNPGLLRTANIRVSGEVLTITQKSGPLLATVVNGASRRGGPIAPGEILVLNGSNLGPSESVYNDAANASYQWETLAGTQVFVNGYPATILYTGESEIAAIVPFSLNVPPGLRVRVAISASYLGEYSNAVLLEVGESAPGVFTADGSGSGQASAVNEDGSPNNELNPAERGSILTVLAVGFGETDPPGIDGRIPGDVLQKPRLPVVVGIANAGVEVVEVFGAPQLVSGFMQVRIRIPQDAPAGPSVPLSIGVGGAYSQEGVTIAIR